MNAFPLIFSTVRRQGSDRFVELREEVGGRVLLHTLSLDEATFVRLEQALAPRPFAKRKKEDDVLCFRSIETPTDDPRRFLGLTIVNIGSRRHLKIELTPESFAVFQTAYDAWKSRFNESRSNTPLQTPTTIAPAAGPPVAPPSRA